MNTPQTQTPATDRQPAWLTVAIREIMVKLTDKTFIIGTLSTLDSSGNPHATAVTNARPVKAQT